MKKWILTSLAGIIITPFVIFSWANIQAIWASPSEVKEVKERVQKTATATEQISALYLEQKARQDKQEAVYQAQMASVDKQLELIAELKKRK